MSKEQVMKPKGGFFYGWIIVLAAFTVLFMAAGTRGTFGIFVKPLSDEFGWSRASISLAISLFSLFHGLSQPFLGTLIDRYGPKAIIFLSALVMGVGVTAMTMTSSLWQLYLFYGVIAAVGFSGDSPLSSSTLLTRWFVRKRGLAISMGASGMSAGQMVIIPVTMVLILSLGWRTTYLLLGGALLVVLLPLILWLVKDSPAEVGCRPDGDPLSGERWGRSAGASGGALQVQSRVEAAERRTSLREALGTWPYRMLMLGFFVCGFTITMITTHLAPYAIDAGISERSAANALGLMGGMSIAGSIIVGALCDRFGRKNPLAVTYFLRGLALLSMMAIRSEVTLYMSAVVIGLSYVATVTPVSALITEIYGQRSMGKLLGVVSLTHQVGSALGAYLGGAIFDSTGSYYWAFFLAALAGFTAAAASFRIREPKPLVPRALERVGV